MVNPAFSAAAGALFTTAVSVAAGTAILRVLAVNLTRLERWLFGFLAGSAALSLLVFSLTAVHLAYTPVFVAAGVAALGIALRRTANPSARSGEPVPRWWLAFGLCLAIPFVELYVCHALGPEYSPDGTTYHLGLVARYLREHHFPIITNNFFASFPQGMEMLFLFAFGIGKHSAAAATHLVFLFAAAIALIAWGLRFGQAPAGIAAAVLVFLSPVAGWDASVAYVDVAETASCAGLFLALQIWRQENQDRMLILAGILAGFAFAIKYPGIIAPVYAAATVAFFLRTDGRRLRRCLLLLIFSAAPLMAPWLIKNAIEVRNPVSPFANRIFPNPYVHVSYEQSLREGFSRMNGVTWKEIPLEITIHGGRLQDIIGPVFLLAPIALIGLGNPAGRSTLWALACFLAPYPANIGTRFLLPALPFLSLAICQVLARWRPVLAAALVFHFVASLPAVVRSYSQTTPLERNWNETLRRRPEAATLRARVGGYRMARYMDDHLPQTARIYQIGELPLAYVSRSVDGYFEGALSETLYYTFFSGVAAFPDWMPTWRRSFHFSPAHLRAIRIEQTVPVADVVWTVSKVRLLADGLPIVPGPGWQFQTSPDSADAASAFSESLAASWKAWDRARPGMFLEAHFGSPLEVTDLQIDSPHDQRMTRLAIRGEEGNGQIVTLAVTPTRSEDLPLPIGYRRSIGAQFKAAGFTHLSIRQGIPGYDDLRRNPDEWGMRFVSELDGYALYQFQ